MHDLYVDDQGNIYLDGMPLYGVKQLDINMQYGEATEVYLRMEVQFGKPPELALQKWRDQLKLLSDEMLSDD